MGVASLCLRDNGSFARGIMGVGSLCLRDNGCGYPLLEG